MKEEEIRVIKLFKLLSNPTRYKIVKVLQKKEMSVTEIIKFTNKAQTSVSHHLNLMKNLDILKYHMKGKNVIYSLKKPKINEFINELEKYYLRIINKN
jgi:ArsR family transcriptional regulator